MGGYLVPELAAMGYQVDVVSLDQVESKDPRITYTQANAKDDSFLEGLLQNGYDAIVDFLIYSTAEFRRRHAMMLSHTEHYIFLSTYRVYADSTPLTEDSPRLLNVSEDKAFLATEDYALFKARQEDILRASDFDNWTIVRPAITYSKFRFQLVTLEANTVVYRAKKGLPVLLPQEAMPVQATMSWAGDVAKMIARLVLNPLAFKETYNVATAEHRTWEEIANYYREIIGLEYQTVDIDTYLSFFGASRASGPGYQLLYDRCFNRVVDNSKVLGITGLRQSELMPLRAGLEKELSALPEEIPWTGSAISERMDAYLRSL